MDTRKLWAAFAATTILISGEVYAQTAEKKPQPPPSVCIGSNCVEAPGPSAGGTLKFHPGFYPFFNYADGISPAEIGGDLKLMPGPADQ